MATLPTIDRRLAILRELAPRLPLVEPRRFYGRDSDESAVPRVYAIGGTNCDDDDIIANILGAAPEWVVAQIDDEMTVNLMTVPVDFLPTDQVMTFEEFAAANDDPGAQPMLWWWLHLPVLNEAGTVAVVVAQLGWQAGAEDFTWRCHLRDGGWHVDASVPYER